MLRPQVHQSHRPPSVMALPKSLFPGHGSFQFLPALPLPHTRRSERASGCRISSAPTNNYNNSSIRAAVTGTAKKTVAVKATVTVKITAGGFFSNIGWTSGLDGLSDIAGKSLLLELFSAELDPSK